jgi:uncharacterized membrane protein YedE/YeeE
MSSQELESKRTYIALALVVLGVILLLVVFYQGYVTYKNYKLETTLTEEDTATILNISAQLLINMLVKIAFLGISLAAGSIILGKGIDLFKGCPETNK